MAKKPFFPNIVTPVGKGFRLHVHEIDPHPKYGGTFKATLAIDDTPLNRDWCKRVCVMAEEVAKNEGIKLKKVMRLPFTFPEDREEDWEGFEGKIVIEAKANSDYPPAVLDTAKQALPPDVKVVGGDTIRMVVQIVPYDGLGSGVSFRMQIVQLVGKEKRMHGLDALDDIEGYVATPGDTYGAEDEPMLRGAQDDDPDEEV